MKITTPCRVGKGGSSAVYDADERFVCKAETPELAALIVEAVNLIHVAGKRFRSLLLDEITAMSSDERASPRALQLHSYIARLTKLDYPAHPPAPAAEEAPPPEDGRADAISVRCCAICRSPLAECMGCTLARDFVRAHDGEILWSQVREICAACAERYPTPEALTAALAPPLPAPVEAEGGPLRQHRAPVPFCEVIETDRDTQEQKRCGLPSIVHFEDGSVCRKHLRQWERDGSLDDPVYADGCPSSTLERALAAMTSQRDDAEAQLHSAVEACNAQAERIEALERELAGAREARGRDVLLLEIVEQWARDILDRVGEHGSELLPKLLDDVALELNCEWERATQAEKERDAALARVAELEGKGSR